LPFDGMALPEEVRKVAVMVPVELVVVVSSVTLTSVRLVASTRCSNCTSLRRAQDGFWKGSARPFHKKYMITNTMRNV